MATEDPKVGRGGMYIVVRPERRWDVFKETVSTCNS